ncbi:MAG: hypothetical protein SPL66_05945 [Lachnospiraceae bacterium]|nr:hypothetical protein [Lachnospiraceae bacterium]
MSKVVPLSPEQKDRLMQRLPLMRKLNDGGLDIIGFNMAGSELEIWARAKRPGYDDLIFPFVMYTKDQGFYNYVYQNQPEQ